METDPAVAQKKRCPERLEAARHDLTCYQIAAREGKIGLFYLEESGFANIPNVQRSWPPKGQPHEAEAGALTLVVLDNASMHHDIDPEKLEDWLVNHRLVLMHLPPYSP